MDRRSNLRLAGEIAVLPPEDAPRRHCYFEPHEIPVGEPAHRRVTRVHRSSRLAAGDKHDLVLEAADRGLDLVRGGRVTLPEDRRGVEQTASGGVREEHRDVRIAPDVDG